MRKRVESKHMRRMFHFVRHGESENNVGTICATPESPLTARGLAQSYALAHRISAAFKPEVVISSPYKRARQTAGIIAEALNTPIEVSELFSERRRPSVQTGRPKSDPEILRINEEIRRNFHLPNWRHSDEENFDELKKRGLDSLQYLESRPENNLLVVTHGITLRLLIGCAISGESLTGEECERFIRALRMEKTGIVTLVINDNLREEGAAAKWQLWRWNDYAHLEDER